uniref:Transposase putative n=1 Tax=Albugo laibachii Nc14 TaxID=890382 RepID=F0WYK2_9STRA|nr:transposase putative [Albugo laibachii Nc14]|eukprot:CCA26560.1 transposase putative [Albugo laibachii Nc14]
MFDGKILLWPVVEEYVKNRQKGTMLSINIEVLNREVYRYFLIECGIPAIKKEWPARDRQNTIYIQQDNAKPHVFLKNEEILAAGQSDGWDIRLRCQSPSLPGYNVLDLGYFGVIQSVQYKQEFTGPIIQLRRSQQRSPR